MILTVIYAIFVPLMVRTVSITLNSDLLDYGYYIQSANFFLQQLNPYQNLLYPPASLIFFLPFAILPLTYSKAVWTLLSLACLYFGLLLFLKNLTPQLLGYKKISLPSLALIISLIALQTFPVKFTLGLGQINLLLFFGYALLYHFMNKNNQVFLGLTLSFITIIKFNPIVFILLFLINKKYKSLLVFFLSFIGINLAIDLFSPFHLNISFIQSVLNMSTNISSYYYNQSLSAFVFRQLDGSSNPVIISSFLSLVLWIITLLSINPSKVSLPKQFILILLTVLLTSPLTWQHHFLLTIPAFLYYFLTYKNNYSDLKPLVIPAFILINMNLKHPQSLSPQNLIYSHAFIGLLLLYFLFIRLKIKE